ncbi:cytochrome P450 [Photorhabdus temperata subsp. temperata]
MNCAAANKIRFNPASPTFSQDLYQIYRHMQQHQPILRLGYTWVLTRYQDISYAMKEPRLGNTDILQHFLTELQRQQIMLNQPLQDLLQRSLLFLEGNVHHAHRKALQSLFSGTCYQSLKQLIQEEIILVVQALKGNNQFDGIAQLAKLIWPRIFARWLNLTSEQQEIIAQEKQSIRLLLDPSAITFASLQSTMKAMKTLDDLFNQLLNMHFAGRESTFFAALSLGYHQDHDALRRFFSTDCLTLVIGGSETGEALIGNLIQEVAMDATLQQRLREDPALIRLAVQETMRYESPLQMVRRTVLKPISFHGRTLEEGDSVLLCIGAANRDEQQFNDAGRFIMGRKNGQRHLGFGVGIHQCIGQLLAQFQAESTCEAMLRILPPFVMAAPGQWQQNNRMLRALDVLPLTTAELFKGIQTDLLTE